MSIERLFKCSNATPAGVEQPSNISAHKRYRITLNLNQKLLLDQNFMYYRLVVEI